MIYILLILLIIQFIFCYYYFNKDLLSPSSILCAAFILSTLACIYNIKEWGVNLQFITVLVIIGGNSVFIIVACIIHKLMNANRNESKKSETLETLEYIDISFGKSLILLITYVLFAIIFIRANVNLISSISLKGNVSVMNAYRVYTINGDLEIPGLIGTVNTILNIVEYVLIYIFINNVIVNHKEKRNYILLLCIILYLVSSVFTAQRMTILLAFIYSLFVTYELLNRKYNIMSKLNSKFIIRGLTAIVIFLLLFGATREMFGRSSKKTIVDNVTYYMGNSIEALDLYIRDPVKCNQFGEELFRQFRIRLSRFGLCEKSTKEDNFLEFRTDANGNTAGNVYTAYRYYIHDFGYISIIFFQTILSIFYSFWYEKLNRRKLKNNVDISFVMYAWFILCLLRFSITNSFFYYLGNFAFTHLYVFVFLKIVLGTKIKWNKKYIL